MSASTSIVMIAPAAYASQPVKTRNGNSYTVDASGFVTVYAIDVPDLLAAGFIVAPGASARRDNFAGTADPSAADDVASDYAVGSVWVNTTSGRRWVCLVATANAAVWMQTGGKTAVVAALGTLQGDAAALLGAVNAVTGADGAKGVILPVGKPGMSIDVINAGAAILKVYPETGGAINGGGANTAFSVGQNRRAKFVCSALLTWYVDAAAGADVSAAAMTILAQGVAAGYKVARGVHTQVAATDTIVTGLTTVVAVIAQFSSAPTAKQFMVAAQIGDQAGSPAAGSIYMKTFKPTAANDCTPIAADDFTDNLEFAWIAIGT